MSASAVIILQKSGRIAELLEERVGVKGATLELRLERARRVLPRAARVAGRRIAAAERKARAGGVVEIDAQRFDEDYRLCLRHLNDLRQETLHWALLHGVAQGMATAALSGVLLGLGMKLAGLI